MDDPELFLNALFLTAIAAANPLKVVPPYLPPPPSEGRVIVIGAGKASAAMAKAVEESWVEVPLEGLVVTRYGYGVETSHIKIVEAAHPVPDEAGEQAAKDILRHVQDLTADDLVLCLISGGGSALLSLPAPGITAEEKREINKSLLRSGAPIGEMNCLRKHLSAIKGGRLAEMAAPAKIVTLLISDVPGDDPSVIASGPTIADPSTLAEARAVIDKYNIETSDAVRAYLEDPAHETPKTLPDSTVKIIAKAQDSLDAAANYAQAQGITPVILGDAIEGEARDVAYKHVQMALKKMGKAPCVLLSGGETTVTIKGKGRGGRNSEYLLSALIAAEGHTQIYGLACDTDGIDGSQDNAGAIFTPDTLRQARQNGLDPAAFLENNDAYSFFEALDGLVVTGPTFTNVNDFRALLVV